MWRIIKEYIEGFFFYFFSSVRRVKRGEVVYLASGATSGVINVSDYLDIDDLLWVTVLTVTNLAAYVPQQLLATYTMFAGSASSFGAKMYPIPIDGETKTVQFVAGASSTVIVLWDANPVYNEPWVLP